MPDNAEYVRRVRVIKLSRNTGWGNDPPLSYVLSVDQTVLHVDHGYASGNVEWLTLVVEEDA